MDDFRHMKRAVELGRRNPRNPFGALIVDGVTEAVIAEGFNRTPENPILHAEIDAINSLAATGLRAPWRETVMYCTAEPCPMCLCAAAWAGIPSIVYGVSVHSLKARHWKQMNLQSAEIVRSIPFISLELRGEVHADECQELITEALEIREAERAQGGLR